MDKNTNDKNGIVLIGMAGAGKSAVGKVLAKKLGFGFVDGDKYIEQKERMKLCEIINQKGEDYFLNIEEKLLMELFPIERKIISPGGSVVYSDKLMQEFKKNAFVVLLEVPFHTIQKRISKRWDRGGGIIHRGHRSLRAVFRERKILYEKYADLKINCRDKDLGGIVEQIIDSRIISRLRHFAVEGDPGVGGERGKV